MQTFTININNDSLAKKIRWLLEKFKDEGLEIIEKEDLEDLKLLKATREDETISFEEYLKDENRD